MSGAKAGKGGSSDSNDKLDFVQPIRCIWHEFMLIVFIALEGAQVMQEWVSVAVSVLWLR